MENPNQIKPLRHQLNRQVSIFFFREPDARDSRTSNRRGIELQPAADSGAPQTPLDPGDIYPQLPSASSFLLIRHQIQFFRVKRDSVISECRFLGRIYRIKYEYVKLFLFVIMIVVNDLNLLTRLSMFKIELIVNLNVNIKKNKWYNSRKPIKQLLGNYLC